MYYSLGLETVRTSPTCVYCLYVIVLISPQFAQSSGFSSQTLLSHLSSKHCFWGCSQDMLVGKEGPRSLVVMVMLAAASATPRKLTDIRAGLGKLYVRELPLAGISDSLCRPWDGEGRASLRRSRRICVFVRKPVCDCAS